MGLGSFGVVLDLLYFVIYYFFGLTSGTGGIGPYESILRRQTFIIVTNRRKNR